MRARRPASSRYEPEDLTVTVGAGTTCAELDAVLAERRAGVPARPAATRARPSAACSRAASPGIRRLRHGPLRDHVLEVRFVTGDGRMVKGGGPTVKNVTGYDLPRLFVGSFGTLGVLAQVTLRCRPRPAAARWFARRRTASTASARPRARGRDRRARVSAGGDRGRRRRAGRRPHAVRRARAARRRAPRPHLGAARRARRRRARRSTESTARGGAPSSVSAPCTSPATTCRVLTAARAAAHDHGGWMLREAGGDGIDGFGRPLPNAELMRRVKDAFDPTGKLSPGRLPL